MVRCLLEGPRVPREGRSSKPIGTAPACHPPSGATASATLLCSRRREHVLTLQFWPVRWPFDSGLRVAGARHLLAPDRAHDRRERDRACRDVDLSGTLTKGSHTNLADEDDDLFSGPSPLRDVSVRLKDAFGATLRETVSDAEGDFTVQAPAATTALHIVLVDGSTFKMSVSPRPGGHLHVRGLVTGLGSVRLLNAETFVDDDYDGESDSGLTIQTIGVVAEDPDDEDSDDDEDSEDDAAFPEAQEFSGCPW